MKLLVSLLIILGLTLPLRAEIVTETIEYTDGETQLAGYLSYDDAIEGKRPGVLVIHDWKGVGDFVKTQAERLAELGYVAFTADIYGKEALAAEDFSPGKQAGFYKSNRDIFRHRLTLGLDVLKTMERTDTSKLAAIGYCFGGTGVLELARSGADIDGVVSFHGGLDSPTPEDAKNIKGSVLVLHGADDPHVNDAEVSAFEKEMRDANVDWTLVKYSNAVHAFTNPAAGSDNSKGAAYNEKAAHRSWEVMKQFFAEIFS